jgi:hypothetical protein
MVSHKAILVLACLMCLPSVARSQTPAAPCTTTTTTECSPLPSDTTETNRGPIIPFLEGTDVFWTVFAGDPIGTLPEEVENFFPYRLEADIFPHLVVFQNFTDVLDVRRQAERGVEGLKEVSWSISGTPAVRIRMLPITSAPVRTPSYMPRGNVQVLWARGLKGQAREALGSTLAVNRDLGVRLEAARKQAPDQTRQTETLFALANLTHISLWELHAIVGHHSNGQDGCLSTEQERLDLPDGDDPCVPEGVVPTQETINRVDGSFSTNYIRVGANYSWNRLEPGGGPAKGACQCEPDEAEGVEERRVRAEVEYHPAAWVDDQMVDLYGRLRFNLNGAWAVKTPFCERRLETSAGLVWNPGVVETVPEVSFSIQVSCFPTLNGGWGFFTRYYQGQDYYNVGFLDDIRRVHVGLTFNQTGFFRFRRPTTTAPRQ